MPTISLASSKGGVGKTTASLVLAGELAQAKATTALIDADPNKPFSAWEKLSGSRKPDNLTVISGVTEHDIVDRIDEARRDHTFAVVDLEGTANILVSYAISRSDLVIIPVQGSQLDAAQAAKTFKLVENQRKITGKDIAFVVLLTRTSSAIQPRTRRHIEAELTEAGIPVLPVELIEREAFRAIFSFGGTLHSIPAGEVGGLDKAIDNSRSLLRSVIDVLEAQRHKAAE